MNLYAYAGNNPVAFTDPLGLCPEPEKKNGTVCVALFIEKAEALGLKGDGRGFSSASEASQSRVYVHVDTQNRTSSWTVNPTCDTNGKCAAAREDNKVDVAFADDGSFTVSIAATNSLRRVSPSIDATFTFRPDGKGGFTTSGNRDAFPSAEAYLWRDGKPSTLFQRPERTPLHLFKAWPNDRW